MKNFLLTLLMFMCLSAVSFTQVDTISYNIYQLDGNLGIGAPPSDIYTGILINSPNATLRLQDSDETAGDAYNLVNNTKGNEVQNFAVYNKTDERVEMSFDGNGNIGIIRGNTGFGTNEAKAKVHVAQGDVYISDINHGIIMKSPDGNCWKGTVDNFGQLNFVLMEQCPDGTTGDIDSPDYSSNAEISIYPNPADNHVSVEVDNMNEISLNLSITDHIGREVETMHISQKKTNIQVSHLPAGVYHISIRGKNIYWNEKLVKH